MIDKLEPLANVLAKDYQGHKNVIVSSLATWYAYNKMSVSNKNSATDLPMKSETYACLAAMLNIRHFETGKDIVGHLTATLQKAINAHDYHSVKNIVSLYRLPF